MTVDLPLFVHIGAGSIGALSGAVALTARKGALLHRASGMVFALAMLTMAVFALYLSILRQPGTIISSVFTFYLVATAWLTVRRKEGAIGLPEKLAFGAGSICTVGILLFGVAAANSPTGKFLGYSAGVYGFLGGFAALAAAFDLKVLVRGGIAGAQRIARHLWRMCLGFFFALASALTQLQRVLPTQILGMRMLYILLILAFTPLAMLIFWMIRVRFTGWYKANAAVTQA
ncbi:MAG TPA: DUF2306 domain-containing protein [Rhizomicrobium sp.]|jgi:uncharacterized membrane protein|nr:DUF2306 domain-containing protein [Rhizomicrobium sp.]